MLAVFGLSIAQLLGIVGSAASGSLGIVAAIFAVRRAKMETRAQVEHECLERIAQLHEQQQASVGSGTSSRDSGGSGSGGGRVLDERANKPSVHDDG